MIFSLWGMLKDNYRAMLLPVNTTWNKHNTFMTMNILQTLKIGQNLRQSKCLLYNHANIIYFTFNVTFSNWKPHWQDYTPSSWETFWYADGFRAHWEYWLSPDHIIMLYFHLKREIHCSRWPTFTHFHMIQTCLHSIRAHIVFITCVKVPHLRPPGFSVC